MPGEYKGRGRLEGTAAMFWENLIYHFEVNQM